MKFLHLIFLLLAGLSLLAQPASPAISFIKIDQFGYLPASQKIAVISSPEIGYNAEESFTPGATYEVRRWDDESLVFSGNPTAWNGGVTHDQSGDKVWWFDFTSVSEFGSFYLYDPTNMVRSYPFEIKQGVYKDVLKAATRMFFYQRCNFAKNVPYANVGWEDGAAFSGAEQDTDCRLVSDTSPATSKDLRGGWFDAGDYNKYINFAHGVLHDLLDAYEQNPMAWTDDFDIPESGNGTPDLLDEVKWELDWFLRMQLDDGSFLHKISTTNYNSASPPSTDTEVRRYAPATTSATRSACGALAHAALVYRKLSDPAMRAYADTLETAALNAWNWTQANPAISYYSNAGFVNATAGHGEYEQQSNLTCAAAYLFALTGNTTYRDYFDANWPNFHLYQWYYAYVYESYIQNAALFYASLPDATPSISAEINGRYEGSMYSNAENFPSYGAKTDAYMAYMTDNNHTWGNNRGKSEKGSMMMNLVNYGIHSADAALHADAAEGYLHYLHGVNPQNMAYLTNMGTYGAENSATTMYHSWFADGSAAWDQVGVSTYGPAPGYLTGGANPNFVPDGAYTGPVISPPQNQPVLKCYKDWNAGWPENSWEITEPSITYQAAYLKLLANFVCPEESNGFEIQINAYLEGSYSSSLGEMNTNLHSKGLLPGMTPTTMGQDPTPPGQPYQNAPFNYDGQEGFDKGDADYPADAVDWVLISLRKTTTGAPVFRSAGLLMKDGTVSLEYPCVEVSAADGPFYVVIQHRNHLAAMSETAVNVVNGALTYDFTYSPGYSTLASGQRDLGNGRFALWTGDVNASNLVNSGDRSLTWNDRNKTGYYNTDVNLDGIVNSSDRSLVWNRRNQAGQVD